MNESKLFKYLIILFIIPCYLYSKTLEINENSHGLKILPSAEIYLDNTMKLGIDEIKTKEFKDNTDPVLAFGFSPKFIFWAKFTIENTSDITVSKIIPRVGFNLLS